jgi:hypothetical protein
VTILLPPLTPHALRLWEPDAARLQLVIGEARFFAGAFVQMAEGRYRFIPGWIVRVAVFQFRFAVFHIRVAVFHIRVAVFPFRSLVCSVSHLLFMAATNPSSIPRLLFVHDWISLSFVALCCCLSKDQQMDSKSVLLLTGVSFHFNVFFYAEAGGERLECYCFCCYYYGCCCCCCLRKPLGEHLVGTGFLMAQH